MKKKTLAVLAFGMSLAGAPAFAADYGQGRDRDNNQQPAADQPQDQHGQGDRGKDHRDNGGPKAKTDQAPPSAVHQSDYQNNNNNNNGNTNDKRHRGDVRNGKDRTPPSAMHSTDWQNNGQDNGRGNNDNNNRDRSNNNNNTNYNNGNDNDRRFDNGNRRNDRDYRGDRNRSHLDVMQYRRNFESPRRYRAGVYHAPRGYSYRRWHFGERLPIAFFVRDFWLTDYIAYGLFDPPPGFVWVRYGDDALLIDTETGEIVQVRYDVFYS